jgi:hypothetical protein
MYFLLLESRIEIDDMFCNFQFIVFVSLPEYVGEYLAKYGVHVISF